ncbi:MAG: SseB family protein [Verrucomicrobiaceae bacterium]|nr:SseB family protein [Verrucomicrobiaceae bacterium]
MDGEISPQWRPEPEPCNALERLMHKAAADPAQHGPLMRLLWQSEIHTLIPYHPEVMGTHQMQPGQQMTFIMASDKEGPFIPAFTSDAAAEYCLRKNAPRGAAFGLAAMTGGLFLQLVNGMGHSIVFNSGMQQNLVLRPEAIAALVKGDLRHARPGSGEEVCERSTRLAGVDPSSLPESFREGVRRFCDRTPVPIAVYLFVTIDPASGQPDTRQWRIILRLRSQDNDFYNDFTLLAHKLLPPGAELATGVVTDDEHALAFLHKHAPLWPVMEAVG